MAKENIETRINILGVETKMIGDITTNGDIRIDGELNGELKVSGKVVVGETGKISGTIECQNIEVYGFIKGKLVVKELAMLRATAKLEADIKTKKLGIEPNAIFTGNCIMGEKISHEKTIISPKKEGKSA
jgi:cytoskeletal protein CcmA (bactofilin family)